MKYDSSVVHRLFNYLFAVYIVFMNVSMAERSPVHVCVESGLLQGEMTGINADFFSTTKLHELAETRLYVLTRQT